MADIGLLRTGAEAERQQQQGVSHKMFEHDLFGFVPKGTGPACEWIVMEAAVVKALKNTFTFFLKIEALVFILRPERWQSGRLRRS
ncbi:hypothetical protein [Taibaiella helva]|uniref:hypothetical protein n=1 Tax=Taibaiella helva TaxID=2301235 RepID=UPI0018E50D3B|nr:hypothetical protein [Taibaiella helva]